MNLAWRLLAPVYDRLAAPLEPARRRVTEAAGVAPGDRVLLAGCGTGLTLQLLPSTADIVAVDTSGAMVERTRRRAADRGVRVDARIGDAADVDLPTSTVDVVCLHLVLSVADRPAAVVREATRVLGSDGRLSVFADASAVEDFERLLGVAGLEVADRPGTPPGCVALVARPRGRSASPVWLESPASDVPSPIRRPS